MKPHKCTSTLPCWFEVLIMWSLNTGCGAEQPLPHPTPGSQWVLVQTCNPPLGNCVRETVKTSLPHSSSPQVNWWGICVRQRGVTGCTPPLPRPPRACAPLFPRPPQPSRGGQRACAGGQLPPPPSPSGHLRAPRRAAAQLFFPPGKEKSRRSRARARCEEI